MMSISSGMGAGQAGAYFSKEDYYLRGAEQGECSRWCGKGAEALGMSGPVGENEFRALCQGRNPNDICIVSPKLTRDNESGELVATHRPGIDCTFSAPKSVSIAYAAGVEGIKEAHDAAVLSVLGHLEEHYCHYRSHEGINNGEMVAAKFDHATSRNVDPQLHSHVFIVNAVHAQDGSWKANEPRAIFQDQKSLGLLYRQALVRELTGLGFKVVIRDRSKMYFELKGVYPRLVEHFSTRRKAIEQQVKAWRSQGLFTGVPHARLYEMAALETRDPKRSITKEEVSRIFEQGFEACGTSIDAVRQELEREREPELPRTCPDASRVVELAVRDLTEREAVVDRAWLVDQSVLISGGEHSPSELNAAIDGGTDVVLRLGQDARGREFYTTKEMRELESRNLQRLRAFPPFETVVRVTEVEAYLERLAQEGGRLTAGQKAEVVNELTGGRGVSLSLGDPGTAKTSTLKIVERFNEEVLAPSGREHLSLNLSYTGKAARELALATGKPAATLDSFENGNPTSKFALQRASGEPPSVDYAGEKVLIPTEAKKQVVLRVDEAGFLGALQADHLLGVVEELQRSGVRVKLHLLGDSKQMQGIRAGDLLRQVRELGARGEIDYAHLTEILRQKDPGLLEIARGLNREDRPLAANAREALGELGRRGAVSEIRDVGELRRAAVAHYLEESGKPSRTPERAASGEGQQVLLVTASNAARTELNRDIREARVAAGEIGEGTPFSVLAPVRQGVTVEGYRLGDAVLFSGVRREDGRRARWGARLNTEGKVTAIDRERNLVQVSYSFTTKKRKGRELSRSITKEFAAAEMAGRTTIYREEERRFSVGDRIVALKNDARLDLQNGMFGVIKALDGEGRARVDLGDREVQLDLNRYRHLDHAYAVTIHKSQGATVDYSIMYAPVRPDPEPAGGLGAERERVEESFGRTSYNALNVAVTRARFDTHLFTNSLEGLARSVEVVDGKSSTIGTIPERATGTAPTVPATDLGDRIQKLQTKLQTPAERELPGGEKRSVPSPPAAPGRELPQAVPVAQPAPKPPERELELTLPRGLDIDLKK